MTVELQKPSVLAIRSNLILEAISKSYKKAPPINIFATGKTTVGKTTLGNRLVGEEYFTVTGRQNTTNEINLIEFPNGLKYFDLPGVDSNDRLENYNRVSLGMNQIKRFPQVDKLTVSTFLHGNKPSKQELHIEHYNNLNFKPDLLLYIVAPHKQISRGETSYLWDLLETHQNIIYVLNFFIDKKTKKNILNSNHIENVETVIKETHTEVLGNKSSPLITKVNCLTGEGVSNLLQASRQALGEKKGKVFSGLISYQQEKTPTQYIYYVKLELTKLLSHTASKKPDSDSKLGQPLYESFETLWNFMSDLVKIKHKGMLRNIWEKLTGNMTDGQSKNVGEVFTYPSLLVEQIVSGVVKKTRQEHYENIYREVSRSKKIYKQKAKYRSVSRWVDDYNRPIKEKVVVLRE